MGRGPEALGMFDGHVPSRGALRVVQSAMDIGINPTSYIKETVETAEAAGRRKIIVKPDNPLGRLRSAVVSKQAIGQWGGNGEAKKI